MAAHSQRPKRKAKPRDKFKHSRRTADSRQRQRKLEEFPALDRVKLDYEEV